MTEQIPTDIWSNVQGKQWIRNCIRPSFVYRLNTIDSWPKCYFHYVGLSEDKNKLWLINSKWEKISYVMVKHNLQRPILYEN